MEEKDALGPVKGGVAGLCIPGKERAVFTPSERKSMLGLDVLANAKRGGSKVDDGLKVPKEVTSVVSSTDKEEKSEFSRLDEEESDMVDGARNTNRRYRETAASENSNPEAIVHDSFS